jgi:hypothetical protein
MTCEEEGRRDGVDRVLHILVEWSATTTTTAAVAGLWLMAQGYEMLQGGFLMIDCTSSLEPAVVAVSEFLLCSTST